MLLNLQLQDLYKLLKTVWVKNYLSEQKKGVTLTKEGEIFYMNAKSILAFNDKVIENIKSIEFDDENKNNDQIIFGIPSTLTYSHKQNILWLIKKNNPKVRIKVIESDSFEMINLVEKNKIDFAISCIKFSNDNIDTVNLYEDPFCVAFYKGHQFQDIKEVSIDMVRKEKIISLEILVNFFTMII